MRALGEVRLNPKAGPLTTAELIAAAKGCDVIVSYRITPGEPALFAAAPDLVAFVRCAVDIRNIDVEAASQAGVLVTQASPGFTAAVAEWVVGAMVDLGRGITLGTLRYRSGAPQTAPMGVQLAGATIGVIGYGRIGQYLCNLARALGMRILVHDPHVRIDAPELTQVDLPTLMGEADFVVCLAVATDATENLMNAAAFARMKPSAFFINASRGNLVDEAALAQALDQKRIAGAAMDVGRAPDQMPSPAAGAPARRDRDAAYRRPDPAGHRAPGARDRGAGRRDFAGPGADRRRQHAARDPARPAAQEFVEDSAMSTIPTRNRPAALVTGGRRGIGRGIAWALAAAGFDVAINDLAEDDAVRETLDGLAVRKSHAVFLPGDISDLDGQEALIERAWQAFGGLDCLVNNAGVTSDARGDLLELTEKSYDRVMAINLRGPFFLTQRFARRLIATPPEGFARTIISVASINAVLAVGRARRLLPVQDRRVDDDQAVRPAPGRARHHGA